MITLSRNVFAVITAYVYYCYPHSDVLPWSNRPGWLGVKSSTLTFCTDSNSKLHCQQQRHEIKELVNRRSRDITQWPESPTVTLTWHASEYKIAFATKAIVCNLVFTRMPGESYRGRLKSFLYIQSNDSSFFLVYCCFSYSRCTLFSCIIVMVSSYVICVYYFLAVLPLIFFSLKVENVGECWEAQWVCVDQGTALYNCVVFVVVVFMIIIKTHKHYQRYIIRGQSPPSGLRYQLPA